MSCPSYRKLGPSVVDGSLAIDLRYVSSEIVSGGYIPNGIFGMLRDVQPSNRIRGFEDER
tara:strand:+ start:69 stop:248 length:180 start_codon:yes stop_codon:yes gene_type:complete